MSIKRVSMDDIMRLVIAGTIPAPIGYFPEDQPPVFELIKKGMYGVCTGIVGDIKQYVAFDIVGSGLLCSVNNVGIKGGAEWLWNDIFGYVDSNYDYREIM